MATKKNSRKKAAKKTASKPVKKSTRKRSATTRVKKSTTRSRPVVARKSRTAADEPQTVVNRPITIPNNEDTLFVSMLIGDMNQTGSTRVEISNDASFPVKNFDGTFNKVPIAPCSQLDRKVLLLVTSVTDTNMDAENNRTEATLSIHVGNNLKFQRKLISELVNEGGTETFIFNITCHVF